jgi:hypothetical protein
MCPAIDNPTTCEIRAFTYFLHAKNMGAAGIHRDLCAVYGQNVMNRRTVRQRCSMFKDGPKSIHDEERSGRPSAVGDDSVQFVDKKKSVKDGASQFENVRVNFDKFHAIFSTRSSQLG